MNKSSSLFKKIQICFSDKKWAYFALEKIRFVFKNPKQNIWFLEIKIQICIYYIKKKSLLI